MSHRLLRAVCNVAVSAALGACEGASDTGEAVDSLGAVDVVVVHSIKSNTAEADVAAGTWQDASMAMFDRNTARIFRASGEEDTLAPIGRTGSGPGEYRIVSALRIDSGQVLALDPIQRSLLRYGKDGQFVSRIILEGGARSILESSASRTIVGGRFVNTRTVDSVYAMLVVHSDGRSVHELPIPFPSDPAGRQSTEVRGAPCGQDRFAFIRTDTNAVWFVDRATSKVVGTRTVPARVRERSTAQPAATETGTSRRVFLSEILGNQRGCVIIEPELKDGELKRLRLIALAADTDTVRIANIPGYLPLSYEGDTLFMLGTSETADSLRVSAVQLSRRK